MKGPVRAPSRLLPPAACRPPPPPRALGGCLAAKRAPTPARRGARNGPRAPTAQGGGGAGEGRRGDGPVLRAAAAPPRAHYRRWSCERPPVKTGPRPTAPRARLGPRVSGWWWPRAPRRALHCLAASCHATSCPCSCLHCLPCAPRSCGAVLLGSAYFVLRSSVPLFSTVFWFMELAEIGRCREPVSHAKFLNANCLKMRKALDVDFFSRVSGHGGNTDFCSRRPRKKLTPPPLSAPLELIKFCGSKTRISRI